MALTSSIFYLIDQIGHLTEGLTEIKVLVQQQAETAQKQLEAIDKQGDRLSNWQKALKSSTIALIGLPPQWRQATAVNRKPFIG